MAPERKLTESEWDEAFKNLEASPVSEAVKAYYRKVWAFLRSGQRYIRRSHG